MQQALEIDPIPLCRENWHRLSSESQEIILGWLKKGFVERVEIYVAQLLGLTEEVSTLLLNRKTWGNGEIDPLDFDPDDTFEMAKTLILAEREKARRGSMYLEVLAWVRQRSGSFRFTDLRDEIPAPGMTLRGYIKQMVGAGILGRQERYKSGAIAIYLKSENAEELIDREIKRIGRLLTYNRTLDFILNSNGDYFTAQDVKDAVSAQNSSTISNQLSRLLKQGLLEGGYQGKRILYRLKKD